MDAKDTRLGRWVAGAMLTACGAGLLTVLLSRPAETSAQSPGPVRDTFGGSVKMTTDAEGSWTAVTVTEAPGRPLAAAFVVQYLNPPSVSPDWQGTGTVTLGAASLTVKGSDREWLFKFPSYGGPIRAGQVALDVIGIVSYPWSGEAAKARPSSHGDFVRLLVKPPVCDYTQCACGGAGAQSCTCGGCSVSCYAPYEACCGATGQCWCCQGTASRR